MEAAKQIKNFTDRRLGSSQENLCTQVDRYYYKTKLHAYIPDSRGKGISTTFTIFTTKSNGLQTYKHWVLSIKIGRCKNSKRPCILVQKILEGIFKLSFRYYKFGCTISDISLNNFYKERIIIWETLDSGIQNVYNK